MAKKKTNILEEFKTPLTDVELFEAIPITVGTLKLSGWHGEVYYLPEDAKAIGIDPGRNFGVCIIENKHFYTYYGRFRQGAEPASFDAFDFSKALSVQYPRYPVVIEGAAYNRGAGQVYLEGVRSGFRLGLRGGGHNALTLPPKTIRKWAFGHGGLTAIDIWEDEEEPKYNHNALDAIGCALAAISYEAD